MTELKVRWATVGQIQTKWCSIQYLDYYQNHHQEKLDVDPVICAWPDDSLPEIDAISTELNLKKLTSDVVQMWTEEVNT